MEILPEGDIVSKIYVIRNEKVMLDRDLAELYGVETKYLKRQVKRNIDRFPKDFMFELTQVEFGDLRSQIGTSSWGGTRYLPMAFTEQGVAQLSSVLNSERAIKVNIQIIRLFTRMRKLLMTHKDLILRVEQMDQELSAQGDDILALFEYMKRLVADKEEEKEQQSRNQIGYKRTKEKK